MDGGTGGATGGGTGGATGGGTGGAAGGTIGTDALQALLQTIINQQRVPSSSTKIKDPKPFNGEQSKLRPFIAHCELKFQIENTKFDTDARKTAFAGALLEGVAWNWVEPFLTRPEGLNQTWDDFKEALEHAFGEVDREEVAYEKFEKIEQGNRTTAAYWAEFQKIKADLTFPDNVCIARFRKGLHLEVKRYMVLHGTPTTDLTTFATAAIQADSRLCQLGLITRRSTKQPEPRFQGTQREPNADPGDPMDLDATRRYRFSRRPTRPFRRDPPTEGCFNCGKKGHFIKDCKQPRNPTRYRKPYRAAEATMEDPEEENGAGEAAPAGNDHPQE
jgi:hypothetical protein